MTNIDNILQNCWLWYTKMIQICIQTFLLFHFKLLTSAFLNIHFNCYCDVAVLGYILLHVTILLFLIKNCMIVHETTTHRMTVEFKLLQVSLWPSTMNQSPYHNGSCKRPKNTQCETIYIKLGRFRACHMQWCWRPLDVYLQQWLVGIGYCFFSSISVSI